ncbi:hypothetical protein QBC44DRAFT_15223 [Cladorrhinum sp. PSN332]|nr:hypothetical protein QBC44DRAFT_15223 [Cladorrhinum sp. PSN332]
MILYQPRKIDVHRPSRDIMPHSHGGMECSQDRVWILPRVSIMKSPSTHRQSQLTPRKKGSIKVAECMGISIGMQPCDVRSHDAVAFKKNYTALSTLYSASSERFPRYLYFIYFDFFLFFFLWVSPDRTGSTVNIGTCTYTSVNILPVSFLLTAHFLSQRNKVIIQPTNQSDPLFIPKIASGLSSLTIVKLVFPHVRHSELASEGKSDDIPIAPNHLILCT